MLTQKIVKPSGTGEPNELEKSVSEVLSSLSLTKLSPLKLTNVGKEHNV